jgi:uncharacterized membrane protein YccC
MDVHPPHKPITNASEFFLHLFTITIGLLIAVGIEGAVSYFHHRHLVHEAEATLREEIEHNAKSLSSALDTIHQEQKAINDDLAALKRIQAHPDDEKAQHASLNAQFRMLGLEDTAWKTAQATEALTYMPYDKAQQYSDIYSAQETFTRAEEKQLEDEAAFVGEAQKFDNLPKMTPQQVEETLERTGVWKAHLFWIELSAKRCDLTYKRLSSRERTLRKSCMQILSRKQVGLRSV